MNNWGRFVNDAVVTEQPSILKRLVLLVSTNGGDVTLYSGTSTAGRQIQQFKGEANVTLSVELRVYCDDGIYIDIGSNVTACLLVWETLPEP